MGDRAVEHEEDRGRLVHRADVEAVADGRHVEETCLPADSGTSVVVVDSTTGSAVVVVDSAVVSPEHPARPDRAGADAAAAIAPGARCISRRRAAAG